MADEPLGVTIHPNGSTGAIGVYESAEGLPVFESSVPYLLSDGLSLMAPLPVFNAGGDTFIDSAGNLQSSLAVSGLSPSNGITWDNNTTWDNGTYWS